MDLEKKLPKEVRAHIFSYLNPISKANASLVCKRWFEVFKLYPCLLEDVRVNFCSFCPSENLKIFNKMSRAFSNFYFKFVRIDEEIFLFLKTFSTQFRRLSFQNCYIYIDLDDPSKKLENCENLLELKVWGCDMLLMFSKLPALNSLYLETTRLVNKRAREHLEDIIPASLNQFSMVDFRERSTGYVQGFYPEVEQFIQGRCSSLRSLDFSGVLMRDSDMDKLSKMEGLRLRRLKVCSQYLPDSTIESFCNHQRGIVELELGDHTVSRDLIVIRILRTLGDPSMEIICKALPRLEVLNLSFCIDVNESVATIFQLKCLRKLVLLGCRGITVKSFKKALEGVACSKLRSLNLCETLIDRSTLSQLLPLIPNLRVIYLSNEDYLDEQWVECTSLCQGEGMKFVLKLNS